MPNHKKERQLEEKKQTKILMKFGRVRMPSRLNQRFFNEIFK